MSKAQFGLLVAPPILTGSLTRLFLGVWTEKYGGRLVFSARMLPTAFATWLLTLAGSYTIYLGTLSPLSASGLRAGRSSSGSPM